MLKWIDYKNPPPKKKSKFNFVVDAILSVHQIVPSNSQFGDVIYLYMVNSVTIRVIVGLGRTPLGLQHTNLCFDYWSPDPLQWQCQVRNLYLKYISSRKLLQSISKMAETPKIFLQKNSKFCLVYLI